MREQESTDVFAQIESCANRLRSVHLMARMGQASGETWGVLAGVVEELDRIVEAEYERRDAEGGA